MSEGKRKYQERLLREVRTTEPSELARIILTHSRFRKAFLLEEYLCRCDRLISTVPTEALELAKKAPEYARLTALEEVRDEDRRWEARAWAVLGSAHRAMGDYLAAEDAFREAADLRGDADEYYSLVGRVVVLRTQQRRYEEAIALADKAVNYFERRYDRRERPEKDNYSLASSLGIRGFTRCEAYYNGEDLDIGLAARDYVRALEVCTRDTPRTRLNALKSLISLLCLGWLGNAHHIKLVPSEVDRSFERILECIKRVDGRRSVPYAEALWIRATARARIAGSMMVPRAECVFLESRDLFHRLEQWEDYVHISVEMAWWYLQATETAKAKEVLLPFLSSDWSRKCPTHWFAVIEAWVETETLEAAAKTVETVRGCKINLPKPEKEPRRKGRWESGGLW